MSRGHHTEGFASLDDASTYAEAFCAEHGFTLHKDVIEWDGEGGLTVLLSL